MDYLENLKLTIGQACQLTGVSQSTLKRWEREGKVIPSPRDRKSAWRTYSMSDVEKIRKVGGKHET